MSESNILKKIPRELGLTETEELLFLDIVISNRERDDDSRKMLLEKARQEFPKVLSAVRMWATHLLETAV